MIFLLFFFILDITYKLFTSVFIRRLCYEWANCWFQNNGGQSKSGSTGKLSHLGKVFVIERHKIWDWWLICAIRTSQCNCDDYTLFWKRLLDKYSAWNDVMAWNYELHVDSGKKGRHKFIIIFIWVAAIPNSRWERVLFQ